VSAVLPPSHYANFISDAVASIKNGKKSSKELTMFFAEAALKSLADDFSALDGKLNTLVGRLWNGRAKRPFIRASRSSEAKLYRYFNTYEFAGLFGRKTEYCIGAAMAWSASALAPLFLPNLLSKIRADGCSGGRRRCWRGD
jgi:hypothetical protein